MKRHLALRVLGFSALGALAVAVPPPAGAAHPHYERLLDRGTYAFEQGAFEEAARDLRLACFGLLEEPETLALCLTRLGLAQAGSDDEEGFLETFRLMAEVEERFGAYREAPLDPGARAAFEAEVAARIPARILERTPAFARLAAAGDEPRGRAESPAPPEEPAIPPDAVAQERTAPPEEPPAAPDEAPAPPPAAPAETAAAEGAPAAPEATLSAQDREILTRAYQLLEAARARQDLDEPYRLATEVANANPAVRGPQHLAAVIAYRSARWEEAVRYFRRGGDPGEADPELLFYLAVSLYESGEPEAAADALRRSLPRIEHTPFVRSYEAKILGQPSPPAREPEPGPRP